MINLYNFKQFALNESHDNNAFLEKKVKDKWAAEDHLDKEGVVWTDLVRHKDGQGFERDGETIAHWDKREGRLYIYNDPSDYFHIAQEKEQDRLKKRGNWRGEDVKSDDDMKDDDDSTDDYSYSDDDDDADWDDESKWQEEDLPFDDDV